ncbi:hypothetical protein PG990_010536 [Apiospora arundinis]
MASLFSSQDLTKGALEVGEGCTPGMAAPGTTLNAVELEIRDKLDKEPEFGRLREMKSYIESLDFLKKDGTTVNVYFVDD